MVTGMNPNDKTDGCGNRTQILCSPLGRRMLITTKTGRWRVTYNGENRPILWERIEQSNNPSNRTILIMSYDHMGRRREKNAQHFFYDVYLQVADNGGNAYTWDCTEPVATRPLAWRNSALNTPSSALYYAHDGNKNVSEIIGTDDTMAAHYEYAPFGAVTAQRGESAAANPWRFSSEYSDDDTATVYYNYRPYEPAMGRWLMRDPAGESGGVDVYAFCGNKISVDINGLGGICDDFSAMSNEVWPPPPGGWAAYVESQRIERERQATENALPNFSLVVGVSGPRNFPIGGGWGISITTDISWKFGTCCDKDNKRKNFRKLIGKISAGPYVGFAPPFVLPKLKPLEVPVGYIGACPEPGETYDGFLSFQFSVGGPYVGCSYSFKDRKWSCEAGFTFEKITDIKLVTEGGVSYEVATIY